MCKTILNKILDCILKDNIEKYPNYKNTGLTVEEWNKLPRGQKEVAWRHIRDVESR